MANKIKRKQLSTLIQEAAEEVGLPYTKASKLTSLYFKIMQDMLSTGIIVRIKNFLQLFISPVAHKKIFTEKTFRQHVARRTYHISAKASMLLILDFCNKNKRYYNMTKKRLADKLGYNTTDWTFYNPFNEDIDPSPPDTRPLSFFVNENMDTKEEKQNENNK